MPDLYVIAGPNGVGKSTYVSKFLPDFVRSFEFLNADVVARDLCPENPESASIAAGRFTIERLRELCSQRKSFALETTLSGKGYAKHFAQAKAAGYRLSLDFLWVDTLGITQRRVIERVTKGGHSIPDEAQHRRFTAGLKNLFSIYRPLFHHWQLLNNEESIPQRIAEEERGVLTIHRQKDFDAIQNLVNRLPMTEPGNDDSVIKEEAASYASYFSDSKASLRALNLAFADVVMENHRLGLPVIQGKDGKVVETPTADLLDLARRIIETNGEPTPEQLGEKS